MVLTLSTDKLEVVIKRKLTIHINENSNAFTFDTNFWHWRKAIMPDYSSRNLGKKSRDLICIVFVQLNPGPPSSLAYLPSHH